MGKIAVSAFMGVLVVLSFVWQAEAFFSRDHWFSFGNNGGNGGNVTQTLVTGDSTTQTTLVTTITSQSTTYGTEGSHAPSDILTPPPPTSVVPEPSTLLLVGSGLMGLGVWKLKQRRNEVGK